jgi:hypothetical protein
VPRGTDERIQLNNLERDKHVEENEDSSEQRSQAAEAST